ncbi:MAG: hypothetical protein FJX76_06220 [Armatimonadetes bacterium]|nr:hypothetical protein [Armatimonadota bacterium]
MVDLAGQELRMTRFKAGLCDHVEVVTAQTALANALDSETAALARYQAARINLAASMGHAENFHW